MSLKTLKDIKEIDGEEVHHIIKDSDFGSHKFINLYHREKQIVFTLQSGQADTRRSRPKGAPLRQQ